MNVTFRKGESPTSHYLLVGGLTLFFSYETIVAYAVNGEGWWVSENVWSRATGKHLNELPVDERLPHDVFEQKLAHVLMGLNFEWPLGRSGGSK